MADATPTRRGRTIGQRASLVVSHRIASAVDLVAEGGVFRPDAAVDDADDDVFALDVARPAVELRPQAAGRREAEEFAGARRVHFTALGRHHRFHLAVGHQLRGLGFSQHGRKAAEGGAVGVQHVHRAHARQHGAALAVAARLALRDVQGVRQRAEHLRL